MKVLAVSDYLEPLHCDLPHGAALAGVELILSCGDLPPDYLSSLTRAFAAPLYYVRGNHDLRLEAALPGGCLDIHARIVPFGGVTILGLEGSHWYNGGPHQYTEAEMRTIIRHLRPQLRRQKRVDIVVAHAAPRNIHDAEDPCHRGFQSFRRLIERYRPRYFLHGHIHGRFADPAERISLIGGTRVVNCAGHYLFEIDEESEVT